MTDNDQNLYSRKVGRTFLFVRTAETSTLRNGTAPTTGYRTAYKVGAMANTGRETVTLGQWPTLEQAVAFVDSYKLSYGLITRG